MFCINCSHPKTSVINSRPHKKLPSIWRRRQCPACQAVFTTNEQPVLEDSLQLDIGGSKTTFSIPRLAVRLSRLLDGDEAADDAFWLARTVLEKLYTLESPISLATLLEVTATVLSRYDPAIGARFELEHHMKTATTSRRRGRPRLSR